MSEYDLSRVRAEAEDLKEDFLTRLTPEAKGMLAGVAARVVSVKPPKAVVHVNLSQPEHIAVPVLEVIEDYPESYHERFQTHYIGKVAAQTAL